jgi:hypothetical protein
MSEYELDSNSSGYSLIACSYEHIFSSTILLMSWYLSYSGGGLYTLELVMNSVIVSLYVDFGTDGLQNCCLILEYC